MKQKVLILGCKGMLGQDLAKTFSADEKYEVVGCDIEDIDITDKKALEKKINQLKPSVIINAVGYNAVDKCEEDEAEFEKAMNINARAPKDLAQIAKNIDAVFVHYVSDYLFDGKKGEYAENDEKSPICKYGLSKSKGEDNVREVGGKYYLIRTSKLFGNPASSEDAKKSFFETMMNLAKDNKELKVVDSEKSCFTYTPDLAKATKELIEKKYDPGIYHIVNEGAVTWFEGLRKCFEIAGIEDVKLLPVGPEEFPRPAKRASSTILINTKFPKLRSYEDALREWLEK